MTFQGSFTTLGEEEKEEKQTLFKGALVISPRIFSKVLQVRCTLSSWHQLLEEIYG